MSLWMERWVSFDREMGQCVDGEKGQCVDGDMGWYVNREMGQCQWKDGSVCG